MHLVCTVTDSSDTYTHSQSPDYWLRTPDSTYLGIISGYSPQSLVDWSQSYIPFFTLLLTTLDLCDSVLPAVLLDSPEKD